MIKAVLFDYGGVLSKGGQSVGRDIADVLGIPYESLNFNDVHEKFRRGQMSNIEFFGTINRRHDGDGSLEKKLLSRPLFYEKQESIYQLAEDLREAGIKTAIFSNVYQPSADALKAKGLYDGFEPIVLSCEVGFAKPDLEFYQLALDSFKLQPEEILLIDDQEKCLVPAGKMGMRTIKFTSPEQVITDVKNLFLQENKLEI